MYTWTSLIYLTISIPVALVVGCVLVGLILVVPLLTGGYPLIIPLALALQGRSDKARRMPHFSAFLRDSFTGGWLRYGAVHRSRSAVNPASPNVWCDFNACGWSGDQADNCYYVLDTSELALVPPLEGTLVLLYDWEDYDQSEVLAQVGRLESSEGQWRARPVGAFYPGPKPW